MPPEPLEGPDPADVDAAEAPPTPPESPDPPGSPEERCARLLAIRNPGWEVSWDPHGKVYRSWRLENGRPVPPCVSNGDLSQLEATIRGSTEDVLTERLRDGLYEMRDRGLLPPWRPGPEIPRQVRRT